MARYTIIVEFTVDDHQHDRFLDLVQRNAALSLRDEVGCERFDVMTEPSRTGMFTLYEIYRDRAAFDAHCCSPHFHEFDEMIRPLVHAKQVRELNLQQAIEIEPAVRPSPEKVEDRLIDAQALAVLARDVFVRAGAPPEESALVSDALVAADLRGMQSHGVLRIPIYVEKLRAGGFKAGQTGQIVRETASTLLIDGQDGFGQVITMAAMDGAIKKARDTGIAAAGVFASNHFGEAAYYVLHAARQDMIGIVATNGSPNMPAWGGTTKMTGPLPFTAGVPAGRERPFILDAALGVTNRGKLIYLSEKGEKIPIGWGVDRDAQPTNDPARVLDGGWILPIGGHKGFGITMFLEILSGVLTGALVGSAIRDLYNAPRSVAQGLGHFCIAINPAAFISITSFKQRMDEMIAMVRSSRLAPGVAHMTIPGEPEFESEERRRKTGIPLAEPVIAQLNNLAAELGSAHRL